MEGADGAVVVVEPGEDEAEDIAGRVDGPWECDRGCRREYGVRVRDGGCERWRVTLGRLSLRGVWLLELGSLDWDEPVTMITGVGWKEFDEVDETSAVDWVVFVGRPSKVVVS